MKELSVVTTSDFIATKILFLRDEKVLLDADLALLYGVETKRLKEAVKRNSERFPDDFMFQLTKDEWLNLRSQTASSSSPAGKAGWGGTRYPPFAFTEQGVAMLSGILNSPRAVETNIAIMRTFVALRKLMETNKDLAAKIRQLEKKYDQRFKLVFDTIQKLIKQEREIRPIGFEVGKRNK
ncbi:MAG: ORF6N domain-containing protein [Flammeovirgaceae bacterium]|nr:ORF6N domain-containing protein [Flammeovirgaceae bacterium]